MSSPENAAAASQRTDSPPIACTQPSRRWRTVRQIAITWPGVFTEPALRALIHRAEAHYNARGEFAPGNGPAACITRLGGKGGRVLIDEDGFAAWIEAGLIIAT